MAGYGMAIVRGRSMLPTLRPGDRLLVRYGGAPTPGRLAVVRLRDRPLSVKRLGWVEEGRWWIERDNPDEGVDSWAVGAIEPGDILAVVVCRLWPRPWRLW